MLKLSSRFFRALRPVSPSRPFKSLTLRSERPFLWNLFKAKKKQVEIAAQTPFPNEQEENEDDSLDFSKDPSLKFLIDDIVAKNKQKPFLLPAKDPAHEGKKTVVLEMDETLLYTFYPDEHEAYLLAPSRDYDYYVDFPEQQTFLSIYLRNNFQEFLSYLQENFEPVLFCNGIKEYVDKVMDIVDKDRVFKHRIYQDGCDQIIYKDENLLEFTKDLNRLNRDLSQVILIDSRPFNYWINPDNCIPIKPYDGSSVEVDKELLRLMDLLDDLKELDDVRPTLRETYGILDILKETNIA